ncbi:MAG: hypothetical protein NC489_26730, partial [Ruminococcus flavefaciens]|nr:hypothetical protein [Ruminococcus flavefaciens]
MDMFGQIAEELHKASQNIEEKKLLAAAPVYLFSVKKENGEMTGAALEELLECLEEKKLFFAQTDGLICLSAECGFPEMGIEEKPGFADETGRFLVSLEQWLARLRVQYQMEQGIIWIRIHDFRRLRTETVWWRQLFRQMGRFKGEFLFLFETEEPDAAIAQEWIGRAYFCRMLQIRPWDVPDYIRFFRRGLEQRCCALCFFLHG